MISPVDSTSATLAAGAPAADNPSSETPSAPSDSAASRVRYLREAQSRLRPPVEPARGDVEMGNAPENNRADVSRFSCCAIDSETKYKMALGAMVGVIIWATT